MTSLSDGTEGKKTRAERMLYFITMYGVYTSAQKTIGKNMGIRDTLGNNLETNEEHEGTLGERKLLFLYCGPKFVGFVSCSYVGSRTWSLSCWILILDL